MPSVRSQPRRLVLLVLSCSLACADEPAIEQHGALASTPTSAPPPSPTVRVSPIDLPPKDPIAPSALELELDESERASETGAASSEPALASEPSDPLAPILPDGPEPGSPESDAELTALLDESTITQAEFDQAFRGHGPNVRDDQLVFGPNQRTREQPLLRIGTPRVEQGKVDVAAFEQLVRADERALLGCHAVALIDDPTAKGSLSLHLRFDASGSSSTVTSTGGEALASSLIDCLLAIAKTWRPTGAGGAKLEVPLTLSTQ